MGHLFFSIVGPEVFAVARSDLKPPVIQTLAPTPDHRMTALLIGGMVPYESLGTTIAGNDDHFPGQIPGYADLFYDLVSWRREIGGIPFIYSTAGSGSPEPGIISEDRMSKTKIREEEGAWLKQPERSSKVKHKP